MRASSSMLPTALTAIIFVFLTMTFQHGSSVTASPAPIAVPGWNMLTGRQDGIDGFPPRPANQGRECTAPTCGYANGTHDTTEVTEGPVIIKTDIVKVEHPLYGPGAGAKIWKVHHWGPPKDHTGHGVVCAGETCVDTKVPGYSRVPLVCTHMAGRLWIPKFWTCCPQRTYASIYGNCCTQLNTTNWHCAKNARIPIDLYLV